MPAVTIRNLPEATHGALKLLAAQHGRSTEAEIRHILEGAVRTRFGMGTALSEVGRSLDGLDTEFQRDATALVPAQFD